MPEISQPERQAVIEIRRPRCPQCNGLDLRCIRSVKWRNDPQVSTRVYDCRECRARFEAIVR